MGLDQLSTGQVSSIQGGENKLSFAQICLSENGPIQHRLEKVSLSQNGFGEISPLHKPFFEYGSTQINAAEVNLTQEGVGVPKPNFLDISEVSLSSSITLQQFLSSHHYNSQKTTVPTWLQSLQAPTQFNLNIEITDLPTGQLVDGCWR